MERVYSINELSFGEKKKEEQKWKSPVQPKLLIQITPFL